MPCNGLQGIAGASLAGIERILGPILADWRHTRATANSAGRSSDDYTLDTSPEKWRMVIRKWPSVFGALP
jgi:hypothetical protein